MTNYMNQHPEAFEDIYEWEEGGYIDDLMGAGEWDPEEEEEEEEFDAFDFDDYFPLSLEYDEGEEDMYADGDFFTNSPGDW